MKTLSAGSRASDKKRACRIKIKLPGGAEIEIEGPQSFVQQETSRLLNQVQAAPAQLSDAALPNLSWVPQAAPIPLPMQPTAITRESTRPPVFSDWKSIVEINEKLLQIRSKINGPQAEKEACLVLLATAARVLNNTKPTASQIAKWLRASGYPIHRVDRAIQEALITGEILASGSRRARRYELTAHGRTKAFLIGERIHRLIHGHGDNSPPQ